MIHKFPKVLFPEVFVLVSFSQLKDKVSSHSPSSTCSQGIFLKGNKCPLEKRVGRTHTDIIPIVLFALHFSTVTTHLEDYWRRTRISGIFKAHQSRENAEGFINTCHWIPKICCQWAPLECCKNVMCPLTDGGGGLPIHKMAALLPGQTDEAKKKWTNLQEPNCKAEVLSKVQNTEPPM